MQDGELRDLLEEIEGALDEQLYNDPHVKECRDNDMDIAPDCEHHVVITEALRQKITCIRAALGKPEIE